MPGANSLLPPGIGYRRGLVTAGDWLPQGIGYRRDWLPLGIDKEFAPGNGCSANLFIHTPIEAYKAYLCGTKETHQSVPTLEYIE
jgi:hypothetical protein